MEELAKDIGVIFRVFVKKYSQEQNYISKSINMTILTYTSLTNMAQAYYHLSIIDEKNDKLKKSFSLLVLFPPPPVVSRDYTKMMKASKVGKLDEFLDQPSENRIKKKVRGKQDTLNNVMYLIANIITYARFYTRCTIDLPVLYTIVVMYFELADEQYSAEYRS